MGKRWKKDLVKCPVCKNEVMRKDLVRMKKGLTIALVCKHHINNFTV